MKSPNPTPGKESKPLGGWSKYIIKLAMAEGLMSRSKDVRWRKPVLIISGVVWIIRAGLELVFQPDYWNPQTFIDYVAVAGTSLGLFLLVLGLWGMHLGRQIKPGLSKIVWGMGVGISCVAGVAAGVANFVEDWFGVKSLGDLFVFGMMFLVLGLLLSGISTIRAKDVSRWTGWLLIACAVGFGIIDWGGGFVIGVSLILLGVVRKL
jgi:hypothetical protein